MSLRKLAAGVALSTLAALSAKGAQAQSTASQVAEVIVTTKRVASTEGLAVQTQVAKNQEVVTQQFIEKQVGSVNAAQLINLLPGVAYSTSDPTGVLSDDVRIHGFDGNHTSWTIDGVPVNDSGNYASFPGEFVSSEAIDRITVNIGQSEIDSPSASAIGGTVNIVTKLPPTQFGFQGSATGGSYNYYRGYAELDTGSVGPWGTRAFFSGNYTKSDKYKGGGGIERKGFEFRVYQPLHDADFLSLSGTYAVNRATFYESSSLSQYAQFGNRLDFNTIWLQPTVTPGKADAVAAYTVTPASPIQLGQGGDASQGFWAYHQNPVDWFTVRGQSRFGLGHGLTFTFDPYFLYTIANGGGNTSLKESDPRFAGNTGKAACADLNGDGDCLDTVLVFSPNNTQTNRYGLLTALLYDLDDHNHFQLGYTEDYSNHRQTAPYSHLNQQTGFPDDLYAGTRSGQVFLTADGSFIRGRDRFSVAELSQVSANYIGRWMDDRLHINVGVRAPTLTRRLNQYCYQYNGTQQYCDTVDATQVLTAYNAGVAAKNTTALNTLLFGAGSTTITYNAQAGSPNFRFPFKQTAKYNRVLPNGGVSYNFDQANQVYFTYSQGFSAPKTDNLYSSSPIGVVPELTDNVGVGYRYQAGRITARVNPWYTIWTNHIVSTPDRNDPTINIDRNVGKVTLYGVDLEAGFRPIESLAVYASASFMRSRLEDTYQVSATNGSISDLPVKGKELVLTPDQTFSLRADYTIGPFRIGMQAKYTGSRYNSDMNDSKIPGFTVVDLDAEYRLSGIGKNTRLVLNVNNLGNTNYYARSSTISALNNTTLPNGGTFRGSTPFYYTGAPTTIYGSLKFAF